MKDDKSTALNYKNWLNRYFGTAGSKLCFEQINTRVLRKWKAAQPDILIRYSLLVSKSGNVVDRDTKKVVLDMGGATCPWCRLSHIVSKTVESATIGEGVDEYSRDYQYTAAGEVKGILRFIDRRYGRTEITGQLGPCNGCPAVLAGMQSCDVIPPGDESDELPPFTVWNMYHYAYPMIAWVKDAIAKIGKLDQSVVNELKYLWDKYVDYRIP